GHEVERCARLPDGGAAVRQAERMHLELQALGLSLERLDEDPVDDLQPLPALGMIEAILPERGQRALESLKDVEQPLVALFCGLENELLARAGSCRDRGGPRAGLRGCRG